jgi:hypothetical protein
MAGLCAGQCGTAKKQVSYVTEFHAWDRFVIQLMNSTKWQEIRLAMYGLGALAPSWRTLDVENGHLSRWDREWYYHFRVGGYQTIEWVEIAVDYEAQRVAVLAALAEIHVPGQATERGFKIFGYAAVGIPMEYLKPDNTST